MAPDRVLALLDVADLAKVGGWTSVTLPFGSSWRLLVDGTDRRMLGESKVLAAPTESIPRLLGGGPGRNVGSTWLVDWTGRDFRPGTASPMIWETRGSEITRSEYHGSRNAPC